MNWITGPAILSSKTRTWGEKGWGHAAVEVCWEPGEGAMRKGTGNPAGRNRDHSSSAQGRSTEGTGQNLCPSSQPWKCCDATNLYPQHLTRRTGTAGALDLIPPLVHDNGAKVTRQSQGEQLSQGCTLRSRACTGWAKGREGKSRGWRDAKGEGSGAMGKEEQERKKGTLDEVGRKKEHLPLCCPNEA